MSRIMLPNARPTETFDFEHEGVKFRASVGRLPDGSIGELFLNAGRVGSSINTVGHDAAVVFSIARQYGVPLNVIYEALAKFEDDSPAGPLGVALKIAMSP